MEISTIIFLIPITKLNVNMIFYVFDRIQTPYDVCDFF